MQGKSKDAYFCAPIEHGPAEVVKEVALARALFSHGADDLDLAIAEVSKYTLIPAERDFFANTGNGSFGTVTTALDLLGDEAIFEWDKNVVGGNGNLNRE